MPTSSATSATAEGATAPPSRAASPGTEPFSGAQEARTPFTSATDVLRAVRRLCTGTTSTAGEPQHSSERPSTDGRSGSNAPASLATLFPEVRAPAGWASTALQSSLLWLLDTLTAAALAPPSQPRGVKWLLLYLTTEGPSLCAAVGDARACQPACVPTQEGASAATGSAVPGESAAAVGKEALALLVRCAASAVLHMRSTSSDDHGAAPLRHHLAQSTSALSCLQASSSPRSAKDTASTVTSRAPPCSFQTYWCSTGCVGLDGALGGSGVRSGWLTEVYGEAGAGKTQLALQCLLQQAATDASEAAVALALAHHPDMTPLTHIAGVAGSVARRCAAAFSPAAVQARRCAVVYLVSEDVPTARLGPLAAGAVARAARAVRLHPLLTQLPDGVVSAVRGALERTCTVHTVLSRLQIRHISSVAEILRLLDAAGCAAPPHGLAGTGALAEAVRTQAGSHGRAVVVLDSIAAAVVAGQWSVQGAVQDDATVAAIGARLRHVAVTQNWCVLVANQVRAVPTAVRQRYAAQAHVKRARSPPSSSASAAAVVPALGMSWATAPHCRIALRKSLTPGVRQLVLCHAPAHPPAQASYMITEGGIEDA